LKKWTVIKPKGPSQGIIITLPGRCGSGADFAKGYANQGAKSHNYWVNSKEAQNGIHSLMVQKIKTPP